VLWTNEASCHQIQTRRTADEKEWGLLLFLFVVQVGGMLRIFRALGVLVGQYSIQFR